MATTITRGNLGQAKPTAGVLDPLFQCPESADAVASTLVVCNQGSNSAYVRVKNIIRPDTSSDKQYIVYDDLLEPNETKTFTLGLCFSDGDTLEAYSDTGNVSFNLYGQLNIQGGS